MRLFVAIRPPPELVPGVRDPHITLRFLGDVDDDHVGGVTEALGRGLHGVARCEGRIGSGVQPLGPTALVVPVAGLDGLAATVDDALAGFGATERRPFHGHLTVGRRRRRGPAPAIVEPVPGSWIVEEVLLVRSELGKGPGGGARHTTVAAFALGH